MSLFANFLYNYPLSQFSTIKIGGLAKEIAIISKQDQLLELSDQLGGLGKKTIAVVGGGSNILFSDNGFDGLVLLVKIDYTKIDGTTMEVGAGVPLTKISKLCAASELSGLEWACGIPCSAGGAVYMNAGAHGGSIADCMISCNVLREGKIVQVPAKDCDFSYRNSVFKFNNDIILSAVFLLKRDKGENINNRMLDNIRVRKLSQPSAPSVGSVFKNADKPAGYYIEQAGLKGARVGDLVVSDKHANFIINTAKGTAKDFVSLVEIIKTRVSQKFGVLLKEEFVKIGEF